MNRKGAGGGIGRAERLEAALRENLRRRKAQARGRAAGSPPEGLGEAPAGRDTQAGADAGGTAEGDPEAT